MSLASPTTPVTLEAFRDAVETMGQLVSALDPAVLSYGDAEALVAVAASGERFCQTAKTLAAGRVVEGTGWSRGGNRTPVDWLARSTKCSKREAAAVLATAERLPDQPHVEAAMRAGQLNSDQAVAVSSAAGADPDAEAHLVAKAHRESLAGLRDHCTRVAAAARADDAQRNARHRRDRNAQQHFDREGAHHFESHNTGAAGATIAAALKRFQELAFQAARARGTRDSYAALLADAFEMLCAAAIGTTPTCILDDFDADVTRDDEAGPTATGVADADEAGPTDTPDATDPVDRFGPDLTGKTSSSSARPTQTNTAGRSDRAPRTPTDSTVTRVDDAPTTAPPDAHADRPDGDGVDRTAAPPGDPHPGDPPSPTVTDLRPAATVIPWEPTPSGVKLPRGANVNITVLVDHTAFTRGHTLAGETCEIAGLGPISVAAVRDLIATGDPFYAALIRKGSDLVAGVHLGRLPNALQRTAVVANNLNTCMIAGCTNTICEIDHHHEYSQVKQTAYPNLGLLCTALHHPMKTAGGTLWWDDHGDAHLEPPPGWTPKPA